MRNRTIMRGSQHLLLASFAAASGAALARCVGVQDEGGELLGEAQQAVTVCVTLQRTGTTGVVKDALLNSTYPNYTPTGADMYAGESSGSQMRALIAFDLSSILPTPPSSRRISPSTSVPRPRV